MKIEVNFQASSQTGIVTIQEISSHFINCFEKMHSIFLFLGSGNLAGILLFGKASAYHFKCFFIWWRLLALCVRVKFGSSSLLCSFQKYSIFCSFQNMFFTHKKERHVRFCKLSVYGIYHSKPIINSQYDVLKMLIIIAHVESYN